MVKRAVFAAFVSLTVLGLVSWRAFDNSTLVALRDEPEALPAPASIPRAPVDSQHVSAALRGNVFHPTRRWEPQTNQASIAQAGQPTQSAVAAAAAIASMRLLGTTSSGNGQGFALLQIRNEPVKLVRRGEKIEGFLLKTIERGAVTLAHPDTTIQLKIAR